MARARSIKPGFFQNEFMASKRPEVQLLFLGLLTIADREGRLEDRPVKIKGQIFPFQDMDVNAALDELVTITDPFQDRPFIYRYEVGGRRYIQIVNFNKHQHIHPNEVASIIPPMPSVEPEEIRSAPVSLEPCNEPLEPCNEPLEPCNEPLEPCNEPSAPKVIPARALPSLPSLPSFNNTHTHTPHARNSSVERGDTVEVGPALGTAAAQLGGDPLAREEYQSVVVPSKIRNHPELYAATCRWIRHARTKITVTPDVVEAYLYEIASKPPDRAIEVINASIPVVCKSPKLYWDTKTSLTEAKSNPPPVTIKGRGRPNPKLAEED